MKGLVSLATIAVASAVSSATDADLNRAHRKIPGHSFLGQDIATMNKALNEHLSGKYGDVTADCEGFSATELQTLQATMYGMADPALLSVYDKLDTDLPSSGRRRTYATLADLEKEFKAVAPSLAEPALHDVYRDGLCHTSVMWFVHHLSESSRTELSKARSIPLLPRGVHKIPADPSLAQAQVHNLYEKTTTCQACHVGGIPNLGVGEVEPVTQLQKARRCYTNYKDLFGIECGPCDGVAGKYWGDDDDKYFTPDPCKVVGGPDDIPEENRVHSAFPPQFSVSVLAGSDRWGRTTNPLGHAETPFPPVLDSMYGQIKGSWYVDIMPESDLWLLRHDTHYGSVSFNGTKTLLHFDVSEIHSQTKLQQSQNNTGPMVSLVDGIPDLIPGGCTCVADPVGVPDVAYERTSGLDNDEMQYLGRIQLTLLEVDPFGRVVVEVDHWANWFFHVFMSTNTSDPAFGRAPKRLCSAYAGTATYDNWKFADPAIADPTVWNRGIPTHKDLEGEYCMNPQDIPMCANISQSTFPPKPEGVRNTDIPWRTIHKSFFPNTAFAQAERAKSQL